MKWRDLSEVVQERSMERDEGKNARRISAGMQDRTAVASSTWQTISSKGHKKKGRDRCFAVRVTSRMRDRKSISGKRNGKQGFDARQSYI